MTQDSFAHAVGLQHGSRLRVLVVDDDPQVRRATAKLLPECDVIVAQSVEQALDLLNTEQGFDAVVSDLMMPSFTGADLHGFISACWPALARRFVLITGGTSIDELRCFAKRIDCPMLQKPIGRLQLLSALVEVSSRPRK